MRRYKNFVLIYFFASISSDENIGHSASPVPTAGDVFTSEFIPCFYFKLRSVTKAKKKKKYIFARQNDG